MSNDSEVRTVGDWRVTRMGVRGVLIQSDRGLGAVDFHRLAENCRSRLRLAEEVIPAYDSLVIQFQRSTMDELDKILSAFQSDSVTMDSATHEVDVDFESGLDWDVARSESGLTKDEFVHKFCQSPYPIAMLGFMPGFVYLDELASELHLPRRPSPRRQVAGGAVAIGGGQCGIYRLASPGGWQVIGHAKIDFDVSDANAMESLDSFRFGDRVRFKAV